MKEGFDYGFFKTHCSFGKMKTIHTGNVLNLFNSFILGNGAYFSDNPQKSHEYTQPTNDDATRILFYTKVILGREMILHLEIIIRFIALYLTHPNISSIA